MKLFIQSIVSSIVVHLIYLVGTMVVGYIKTINYTPIITSSHHTYLQNEVAFGYVSSVPYYISILTSFTIVAIISALLITLSKRIRLKFS
ncbi:hypothetical protein [Bacillus sp. FJAT-45066]|uniref:hypothetical protein n=1 Tax=Bacillus sp. FJAT-45066 TaxID=2011010 RepID=UPI000BB90CDC|nr:hypothetical protein [Bacillus sp. FJAT-45066]